MLIYVDSPSLLQEHDWFCSSHFAEVIEMLLSHKTPEDEASSKSRFACFHVLMAHGIQVSIFPFVSIETFYPLDMNYSLSVSMLYFIKFAIQYCLMKRMTKIRDVVLVFLQSSSEEENEKAFLILNEMILTLKDVKHTVRFVTA